MVILTASRKVKRGGSRFGSPLLPRFLRRRVNPRAASDSGTWSKRVATIPVVPKASTTIPDSILGPLFVNSNCLMCCLDYFGL